MVFMGNFNKIKNINGSSPFVIEEGTISIPSSINGSVTYSKLGNMITYYLKIESKANNTSGDIILNSNLPFNHQKRHICAPVFSFVASILVSNTGCFQINEAGVMSLKKPIYGNDHSIRAEISTFIID